MKKLLSIGACLLFATPVMAQSVSESTGVNSTLGIAPTTRDFVKEAVTSDMFEIKSSKLAVEKGDASTKEFAGKIITAHEKTSADLKGMVTSGKVKATVPTALDSSHQKMLDKLNGMSGADFDKEYASDQVRAHKDAVSLFQGYGKNGKNNGLKTWAANTEPTLQDHLDMAHIEVGEQHLDLLPLAS